MLKKYIINLFIITLIIILLSIIYYILNNYKSIREYRAYQKNTRGYTLTSIAINKNYNDVFPFQYNYNCLALIRNSQGIAYYNMANIFFKEENLEKAKIFFNSGLAEINNNQNYDLFYAFINNNLGMLYSEYATYTSSISEKKKLYSDSLKHFDIALNSYIYKDNNFEKYPLFNLQCQLISIVSCNNLAYINIQQRDFKTAIKDLKKSKYRLNLASTIIKNPNYKQQIMANSNIFYKNPSLIFVDYFWAINDDNSYEKFVNMIENELRVLNNQIADYQKLIPDK